MDWDSEKKEKIEKECRDFKVMLKKLYWSVLEEHQKEESRKPKDQEVLQLLQKKMNYYQEAYKKMEILQERRHLTLIGEKGGYKQAYQTMLKIIEDKYTFTNGEEKIENVEKIINGIDTICKEYKIEIKKEESKEQGEER